MHKRQCSTPQLIPYQHIPSSLKDGYQRLTSEINIHHSILYDPVVDKPRESPRNCTFGCRDCYHHFASQLLVAVQSICRCQIRTHLCTNAQHAKAKDRSNPVRLVMVAWSSDSDARKGEECGEEGDWKTHFGLTNAAIASCIVCCNLIG